MASLLRVTVRWTGLNGGPGYNVFHFRDFGPPDPVISDAEAAVDKVDAFYGGFLAYIPNAVTIATQSDVEVIDEATGVLQSILQTTPVSPRAGAASGSAAFASAVGAVVSWRTGGIRNGRRVRGRTFLVPLSSTAFQSDGTLLALAQTAINNAATTFRDLTGFSDLSVYARPSGPGATDGVAHAVEGHTVPDMGAVLRSRRS